MSTPYQSLTVDQKLEFLRVNNINAPQEVQKLMDEKNRPIRNQKYSKELFKLHQKLNNMGVERLSSGLSEHGITSRLFQLEEILVALTIMISSIHRFDNKAYEYAFDDGLSYFITRLQFAIDHHYVSFEKDYRTAEELVEDKKLKEEEARLNRIDR